MIPTTTVVHVTLALVSAALLRTLALAVKNAHCRAQLHSVLDDHRALLLVVDRFSRVFEEPLFHMHAGALAFALLATTSLVKGHRDFYVVGLLPTSFAYPTIMGLEGDLVQEAGEQMLLMAYASPWPSRLFQDAAGLAFNRDVLAIMLRASRPVNLKARWLGSLSLHTLHRILGSWYSFTQLYMGLS
ncbi:uncharacterized protein LOC117644524 [Thrips palmi]|uniref:Uncharacterized protein LOC117644524 n=1 Tax=Thrips palmi TaxID=161013 RepID=A0A6P8Z082_THRPL|nr:uncharacterized protein LOC117644524 [Thrips palmi]